MVSGFRSFPREGEGGTPSQGAAPLPLTRTRTGYPLPHLCLSLDQDQGRIPPPWPAPALPSPSQDQDRVPPALSLPHYPLARTRTGYPHPTAAWAGNAMDKIQHGWYASCIFTQGDFLVKINTVKDMIGVHFKLLTLEDWTVFNMKYLAINILEKLIVGQHSPCKLF